MSNAFLSTKDRKLLMETKKVMEEVLETQEILADRDLLRSIKFSKRDAKAHRTIPWEQLKRELRSKKKL